MRMLSAAITCAKSSAFNGPRCEPLYLDLADPAELPEVAAKALGEAGWTERDSEHYCPRHDPADVGEELEIGARYVPVGDSGWEIRVPPSPAADTGVTWLLEIRRAPDAQEPAETEPVSATDWSVATIGAFLAAWAVDGHPQGRDCEIALTRRGDELHALTEPDLGALLFERAGLRALAPDSRYGDDPFYRPGGVYVSENGWWRFTCKAVAAGIALGVEECLKDRMEPRFTRRNVWRSVRPAGCDTEVGAESG